MTDTSNPVEMRIVDDGGPKPSAQNAERRKFEDLASKLVQVPKAEIDKQRQKS